MARQRGSCALLALLVCGFLAAVALVELYFAAATYTKHELLLEQLQLRTLAGSVMQGLAQTADAESPQSFVLYPGQKTATLTSTSTSSTDSSFSELRVTAATARSQAVCQRLTFTPSPELQALAQSYGLIASYGITNSNYLPDGTLYTSNTKITVPSVDFLEERASTTLDLDDLHQNGGNHAFVYLPDSSTTYQLTYSKDEPRTQGALLIATPGHVTIADNFNFSGLLILITKRGAVTLGKNVTLDSALIISKGRLTIGSNCKLTGIFMAQDKIVLDGTCKLTQDASVVAPFSSYITSVLP